MIDLSKMSQEDIKKGLIKMMADGWIVFMGEDPSIELIASQVYPQGTPEGNKFVYIETSSENHITLGKRTDRLRAFLSNPPQFDSIVLIKVGKIIHETESSPILISAEGIGVHNGEEGIPKIAGEIAKVLKPNVTEQEQHIDFKKGLQTTMKGKENLN